MKITVVSRSWPSAANSGLTLAVYEHVRILIEQGHDVSIIGSVKSVIFEDIPVSSKNYIESSGSGSLYSPVKINKEILSDLFLKNAPELVLIESWQTGLTDTAIDVASELGLPIIMISHGISVHKYNDSFFNTIRAFAWFYYRFFLLKKRILKLKLITTLSLQSTSKRFYDRDMALALGVPVLPLVNFPINWVAGLDREFRSDQIVFSGYFSNVKNQLQAIKILSRLPSNLKMLFVGKREGNYYQKCLNKVKKLNLLERVEFKEDTECDIGLEIAKSFAVLSTSITEALPIFLLEAMAAGTPFVATSVGAVTDLKGGVLANNTDDQVEAIKKIYDDKAVWRSLSQQGKKDCQLHFTKSIVKASLIEAIKIVSNKT